MRRTTTLLVAAMLVVGSLLALPMAGVAAQTTETETATPTPTETDSNTTNETETNESDANASVAPGAQLSGVVGVQEAELEGEVESRTYGIKVARAAGNDSRAAVASQQLADLEQRLSNLSDRREALREARANGSMSDGEFRARMARLAAEVQTVERLANQTNETVQGLPAETLEAKGINVSAIQTLRQRAQNLTGPEVAEIARSIAGARVGSGFGPEQAGERGPEARENRTTGQQRGGDARGNETEAGQQRGGNDAAPTQTDTGQQSTTNETDAGQQPTSTATETGGNGASDGGNGGTTAGDGQGR